MKRLLILGVLLFAPPAMAEAKAADQFTYIAPPVVLSLSPSSGGTAGGTLVTITGTGFVSGNTVTFGANVSAVVTFISATQLTAISPPGVAGTVTVSVH